MVWRICSLSKTTLKKVQNGEGLVFERKEALAKLSSLVPRSPCHCWEEVGELAPRDRVLLAVSRGEKLVWLLGVLHPRMLLGRFGSVFDLAWLGFILLFLAVKYEELYCFSFNPKLDKEEREQGWTLIDLSEEYKRMGLPNNYWQLSDVNRDYRVSAEASNEI